MGRGADGAEHIADGGPLPDEQVEVGVFGPGVVRVQPLEVEELRVGGDVLIAIDAKQITNQSDLSLLLNRSQPGDTVTVTIVRDGKKMDLPVKLGGD